MNKHNKVISILALAEKAGMSTGFISTARATHATPACLYAHSADRNFESDKDLEEDAKDDPSNCTDIGRWSPQRRGVFQTKCTGIPGGNFEKNSLRGIARSCFLGVAWIFFEPLRANISKARHKLTLNYFGSILYEEHLCTLYMGVLPWGGAYIPTNVVLLFSIAVWFTGLP